MASFGELLKAIKDFNLRRLISFHGRVKGARRFSEDIVQVAEWLDHDHKPSGNLWANSVSGEMPTIARRQKLKRLKNIGNGDIGLLSNARCRVSPGYKTGDGFPLGSWVRNLRSSKDAMNVDYQQRLEALPGWSWEVLSDQWEQGFSYLKQFTDREEHCRVSLSYKTEDGFRVRCLG